MANRWLNVLFGVALIQGILTFSPIHLPEEAQDIDQEWIEYSRMLRDPAYRLPTTTRPRHYEVSLTPYFETVTGTIQPFTFDGEVTIYLSPTEANIDEIVIHCNDLTINTLSVGYTGADNTFVDITAPGQTFACEMPWSFLRIRTSTVLLTTQEYIVRSTFRGNLQTNMRGFYRSWYIDSSNQKRWMGTTQFQPGHARQAFPCYDEPGFKATFDITMNREAGFSNTISNMPIRSSQNLANGRVSETFYTTPATSTYLLAFIVSHYQTVSTNNDTVRPFSIYARDNIGNQGDYSLEVGMKLLETMEEYTDIEYYEMATNMNMKQAAIPDFSAGAMENWGLLTYREALILYDPVNTNNWYRQRIANIVSHEIAHMWFGNLVTCAWWDNLWLNEGFARFYQYFLTHRVEPEMGYDIRFITEQVHTAMFSDSVDTAHPLTDTSVNDPATVSAHFSTITYARGAAVLRMTQYLLGEDTYVKGLRRYLKAREYNVAEPHHLFNALDEAAAEDSALSAYGGITIDQYFRTWSEKAGHPLITVTVNQSTGRMIVTQSRWERNTGQSQDPSLWHIPITWTRGGAPEFQNLKPSQIITEQSTVIERGTSGFEWVLFNKQESGFYRVNYDDVNWALLTQALRSEQRTLIHEFNRAQIVDDVFQLARANVISYIRAWNILSFLEFEDAYAPWLAAINGLSFVIRRLAHDTEKRQKLNELILSLSPAVVNRLGLYEDIPTTNTYMENLQRMYVMELFCNAGHQQCINVATQYFQAWRGGGFIPANMRPWVYCNGLRYGTAEDFNFFWNRYLQEDLANEKVVMLQYAGCTTDTASLEVFLNSIVSGSDDIRAQDHSTAISSAITANEENTMRVFNWLTRNVAQTAQTIGTATFLNTITGRLLYEEQISEVNTWVEANRELLGTSYTTAINGIATARSNLAWSAQRMAEFDRYFETGYVEDVLDVDVDDETTTTEQSTAVTTTTEAATTADPGSANIAALSFITLIVTLAVNFVNY